MAANKPGKREFDWRSYTKPPRILTSAQEHSLVGGLLSPLLAFALGDTSVDFEIRAGQATLYYLGSALARIAGHEPPFSASIDTNLRLPRGERATAERLESLPLSTAKEVTACVGVLAELRAGLDAFSASEQPSARAQLTEFAMANRANSDEAELVVIDIEYQYGRRRFDFVGMRRATSVGGAGAFTTPRLVLGELYTGHRSPHVPAGLPTFGADAAEFAHALSGEHLERAKLELAEELLQRQRLGLSLETPFAHFASGMPELVAVFTDPAFVSPAFDSPLAELHDRAVARHFPADLLRFAAVGDARRAEGGAAAADPLALRENDLLPYRAFKGMRKRIDGLLAAE